MVLFVLVMVIVVVFFVIFFVLKIVLFLEYILQIFFGKKKLFDFFIKEFVEFVLVFYYDFRVKVEGGLLVVFLLDLIVQQFGQFLKEKVLEEEEDDRLYDFEEEYGFERVFDIQVSQRGRRYDGERVFEVVEREEVVYDSEDETILEEVKVTIDDLFNRMCVDVKGSLIERFVEYVVDVLIFFLVE